MSERHPIITEERIAEMLGAEERSDVGDQTFIEVLRSHEELRAAAKTFMNASERIRGEAIHEIDRLECLLPHAVASMADEAELAEQRHGTTNSILSGWQWFAWGLRRGIAIAEGRDNFDLLEAPSLDAAQAAASESEGETP